MASVTSKRVTSVFRACCSATAASPSCFSGPPWSPIGCTSVLGESRSGHGDERHRADQHATDRGQHPPAERAACPGRPQANHRAESEDRGVLQGPLQQRSALHLDGNHHASCVSRCLSFGLQHGPSWPNMRVASNGTTIRPRCGPQATGRQITPVCWPVRLCWAICRTWSGGSSKRTTGRRNSPNPFWPRLHRPVSWRCGRLRVAASAFLNCSSICSTRTVLPQDQGRAADHSLRGRSLH
jgi:hypothetical protein